MRPFVKAGKVDSILRPRILANGVFATPTGYGVGFAIGGVDSEGLDRQEIDYVWKQITIANQMLPDDRIAYEYLITTKNDELPSRPISNDLVRQQAQESEEFAAKSRSTLRKVQNAALLYEQQLRMVGIKRLNPDELVQVYSYLLNLDRSLMTRKAAPSGQKLGRVHIGLEGDHLRVGKRYCQVLSLVEPPRGTRPDLWSGLLSIDCEMVFCSIWQRKPGAMTRSKAEAVENAVGMAGGDIWSAAVGGYNPLSSGTQARLVRRARKAAGERGRNPQRFGWQPLLRALVFVRAGSFARQRGD